MSADVTAMLRAFSDAWNRHDLDAIMAMSTDDCEFWSAAGPDVRQRSTPAQRPRSWRKSMNYSMFRTTGATCSRR